MSGKKTVIVTGASGGIGAGLVDGFLRDGYNVVATSREASRKLTAAAGRFSSTAISASSKLLPMSSRQRSVTSEPSMFW